MEEEHYLESNVKEESQNKDSLCRVCASCTQLLIPIFDGEGLENKLPEKMKKHLPVQIVPSDNLPVQVCYHCASTILSWHELTTTCIEAERKLQQLFGGKEIAGEVQVSPASARGEDGDPEIFEDDESCSRDMDHDHDQSSYIEDLSKDKMEDNIGDGQSSSKPQGGSDARFIAEVTEDCDDVVCLDSKEESDSISPVEFRSQRDHSYTREPQKLSKPVKTSPQSLPQGTPETCRPNLPVPPLVHFAAKPKVAGTPQRFRPILPLPPLTKFNAKPNVSAPKSKPPSSQSVKNTIRQSQQLLLLRSNTERGQKAAQIPLLLSVNKPPVLLPKFSEVTVTRGPAAVPRKSPVKSEISITKVAANAVKAAPAISHLNVPRNLFKAPSRAFACTICGAQFTQELVRRRHMYLRHGVKPYACEMCRKVFRTKDELTQHVRETHVEKPKHVCGICKESFVRVYELKQHVRDKHPTSRSGSRLSVDDIIKSRKVIAGVAITDKEGAMLKEFHSVVDSRDVYHCKECKKSWTNLEKTICHIRTHTKEQLYSCEICDQKFNTRGVKQRHMQVHQNRKPFACEYCDKTFSSKQNRDDHHRFHTKEVKTVCESCGEFLTSASMLYYHRKIHSGVNPYKCPYCDKAYSIRSLLKRHIRYHTGETPHLCSVCGRGFKTSGQLRGHSAVHSDARPFACDGCGAMLKTRKYLLRHRAICASLRSKENNGN